MFQKYLLNLGIIFSIFTTLPHSLYASVYSDDDATATAIRLSLLGDKEELQNHINARIDWERQAMERDIEVPLLSDNLMLLQATTLEILPRSKNVKKLSPNLKFDRESKALLDPLKKNEPRDQYYTARGNRKYEQGRRVFNSTTQAFFSILQLNLYGILQPPIDFATYIFSGQPYLSPEERRELFAAREANDKLPQTLVPEPALDILKKWPKKRRETATLQARVNAKIAEKYGYDVMADWWWRREMLLTGADNPNNSQHLDLIENLLEQKDNRQKSLSVNISQTNQNLNDPLEAFYIQSLLLNQPIDSAWQYIESQEADETVTSYLGSLLSGTAARELKYDNFNSFEIIRDLTKKFDDPFWKARWKAYQDAPEFYPHQNLRSASRQVRSNHLKYVFNARPPREGQQLLTIESSRIRSSSTLQRLRGLFIIDSISRLISLPLIEKGTFSREIWLSTWERTPDNYLVSDGGEKFQSGILRALNREKQYDEGIALARELNDEKKVQSFTKKLVKSEINRILNYAVPEFRIEKLRELEERFIDTEQFNQIQKERIRQESIQDSLVQIDRKTLKRYEDIWRGSGLLISLQLLDGKSKNGEISKEGVYILKGDRVTFYEEKRAEWMTLNTTEGTTVETVRSFFPRQRAQSLQFSMDQPGERRRIPLELQGSAFPGFSIYPGLVPLQSDPSVRRLYE